MKRFNLFLALLAMIGLFSLCVARPVQAQNLYTNYGPSVGQRASDSHWLCNVTCWFNWQPNYYEGTQEITGNGYLYDEGSIVYVYNNGTLVGSVSAPSATHVTMSVEVSDTGEYDGYLWWNLVDYNDLTNQQETIFYFDFGTDISTWINNKLYSVYGTHPTWTNATISVGYRVVSTLACCPSGASSDTGTIYTTIALYPLTGGGGG